MDPRIRQLPGRLQRAARAFVRSRTVHVIVGFVFFFATTAFLFWYVEHDDPAQQGVLQTPLDVVYWWLITCTTVGYGDITPQTQAGKLLVGFTVIVGVAMVTAGVARLGSFFLERRLALMRGHARMDQLSDHIVVCGWHDDMEGILGTMLSMSDELTGEDLVLVNQQDADVIDRLRSRREFKGLHFVSGDYANQADLHRAGVERAHSVIILSDSRDPGADSATLLGVMAVRQLSRVVHLCAEVREERFVPYMVDAGCDEVLHLGSFRRSLAAQVVLSPGMGNIFAELVQSGHGTSMEVEPVPDSCHGGTFADVQRAYAGRGDEMVIGLLENVGNPYEMKRSAIRAAQMAPDISQLVSQLQAVRDKKPNQPVLCPPPDHPVGERTCAVLLRRRTRESG